MSIQVPFLPLELYSPEHHVHTFFNSSLQSLQAVTAAVKEPTIENFPVVLNPLYAFPLIGVAFPPVFFVLLLSSNSRHPLHILTAIITATYLILLPLFVRTESQAAGWFFSSGGWLFAHKVILWLITDFDVFKSNVITKYDGDLIRQSWEYIKLLADHRTGIPKAWRLNSKASINTQPSQSAVTEGSNNAKPSTNSLRHRTRKGSVNARTAQTVTPTPSQPKYWRMSTVGPNIPSFIVRSVLATLLAYILVNTPSSILDTSFYSVRSFKTNFLLVNMIWLFGTVGWDLASLSVRSLVAVGTSLHQSSFPESDILIANPKEHTVAFYVQDALAFITNYIPMFGNIYTLKSVGDLWGRLWHQNFKSVFSDLVYYKLTDPRKKSVRQTLIAVSATFLVSGLLHDYMIATASGLEAAKFEHTLFFLIQPFFLVAETIFFSSRISKQRISRFLFLCLELYINGGLLSLFVRHFLRYDTHKSMAYPFTVVDWKRLDSQGILLSSIQTWLTTDSIFRF